MKKIHGILLVALLAIGLAACGTPTATTPPLPVATAANSAPTATTTPSPAAAVVTFVDPVLEAMVRGAMGKLEGDITVTEAQAVTRLDLSNEWQRYISDGTAIKDIGGLERFSNLESLDLSLHAITDVSALEGLTKLTSLSLGGNPLTNISPLAGLTNLKVLILSNCAAQDYSPLANLTHLEILLLDHSTITDLSPLGSLTGLKYLYLANSPVSDYSPIAEIYPNLEKKDFIVASTLEELGFTMDNGRKQAIFDSEEASIRINHVEWGVPPVEGDANCVWTVMVLAGEYKTAVGFYPDLDAYVVQMFKDGEMLLNYVYDPGNGGFTFEPGERERLEQVLRAALPDDAEAEDVLLAPIPIFNEIIRNTFSMTADALYALPFQPPTLKSLGFFSDKTNAVCLYEQRGEKDYNIEIYRPEWGEKDYDVRFFTPLSDEYRIVITYQFGERKFVVGADDNDGGGASFEFFPETQEHVDGWSSNKDMTVEEYFLNAYNDPGIGNVYLHSVELMQQYFSDTFGMTMEELYTLPSCE